MSGGHQFELRDAISPYVCSTPLDFCEERNYLARVVFPQLNQLCKSRGSFFNPTDLRWAPGDANTEKGFLLTTVLSSIKRCSPFFICLLGETYGPFREACSPPLSQFSSSPAVRKSTGGSSLATLTSGARRGQAVGGRESRGVTVGGTEGEGTAGDGAQTNWLDKNFLMAGKGGHSWVLQEGHQNSSITELEVTQGVLLCDSLHSTLYYRQSDHLDDKLARAVDKKAQDHLLQRFMSESEEARAKVHDLRQRMVNRGVPVRYFRSVEELGQIVLEDWVEVINTVLPPLCHSVRLLDTLEFKEWQCQQSFIRSRTQAFVASSGVDEVLQTLTDFAFGCQRAEVKADLLDELLASASNNTKIRSYSATTPYKKRSAEVDQEKPILVLVGDRGVGKSSLAARWLTDFKGENSSEAAGIAVLSHFVSASSNSADLVNFIRHCIVQLREAYLLSEPHDPLSIRASIESESEAKDQSFRSLCEAFVAALGLGPCVILLDGLNELTSARGLSAREVKELTWLQESLPRTCRLILTTTRSDISYRSLVSRRDVTVVKCPDSITEPENTLSMVKQHNPLLSQLVGGDSRLQRVAQLKIMSTALGARVVASEISCHRVYSNLPAFLEECAEASYIFLFDLVWSLRDFWIMSVKKWILEHNWTLDSVASENVLVDSGFDFSGWVTDSLCLIAVSRNGLTANQILSILEVMGYEKELKVASYDWLQFRMSAGATLREMEDGRLVFGHRYLQEIAEYLFFKSMASVSYDPAMVLKLASSGPRKVYHAHLAQFFSREPLDTQVMEELPWQLMWSGQIPELTDFLTDCGALLKMLSSEGNLWQQDLKLYWSVCQLRGYYPATIYLQLTQSLGLLNLDDVHVQGQSTYRSGSPTESLLREPNPRIVVSTPQPHTTDLAAIDWDGSNRTPGHEAVDKLDRDEEKSSVEEDDLLYDDLEMEHGHPPGSLSPVGSVSGHQESQPHEETTAMFLTQGDIDNEDILTSGTVEQSTLVGPEEENNFPGVFSLCWQLARFLQALNENQASGVVLTSLINYIKKNYPLTLEQQLMLCRCHHAQGSLAEATRDLNYAEQEYRQALHTLVAAEDMDEELDFVEDTKYLKGLLLSCHGNLRVVGEELFDAEELLKEALECVEDDPNCLVLKSAIFANLGKLRYAQQDFPRAESCAREACRLRCRWFGRCHPLVADVLVSLAQLLADTGNLKGQDVIQAEHLFRRALTISEKCFGPNSLPVASVLCHLGELLAQEESHPAKMEAQKLLRRSMDIRTSELGRYVIPTQWHRLVIQYFIQFMVDDVRDKVLPGPRYTNLTAIGGQHPVSQATQQSLTRVDVALKMGHYEFGSARHAERRATSLPFSSLTFRDDDLTRLHSRASVLRADTGEGREQPISIRAVSREEVMRHNQPGGFLGGYGGGLGAASMSSLASASERLLTAPGGERGDRLLARRQKELRPELRGRHGLGVFPQGQGEGQRAQSGQESGGDAGGDLVIVESLDSKGRRHLVGEDIENQFASSQNNLDGEGDKNIDTKTMQAVDADQNVSNDHDGQLSLDLREVNPEFVRPSSRNQGKQTLTVHLSEGRVEEYPVPASANVSDEDEKPGDMDRVTANLGEVGTASQRLQETASKKSVVIRPASGSRRMFERYSSGSAGGELCAHSGNVTNLARPSTCSAKTVAARAATRATSAANTMSARSRRVWSGRSVASSATSGHISRCHIPGPHDIASSARMVNGPNSTLSSLLGEPSRPRPASRPSEHHHRAAWYHVPGRYTTPQERFPRKRMQKTENARDIEAFVALKSQWAKRRQVELQQARLRGLQLEEEGADRQNTAQPEAYLPFSSHTKQIAKRNVTSSSKPKTTSESHSKFSTRSADHRVNLGPVRRLIHPDSTPRLMISGLDMVPEQRYPDRSQTFYSTTQSHAVKFREPNSSRLIFIFLS
ncbi:hypothetical protein EGW08_015953 [Elysia chlorotica]|uniref:Nephrocystin 3-like N-terminal domain-containing protein n=1 Tax=Elysia chlorotica TaxID=188477 RepID=A0A3S1B6P6_ELYCH|nr:hypothetical protein EGW08_015953 [Elysia chlorotica]